MFEGVVQFHKEILNQPAPEKPTVLSEEMLTERFDFLMEELTEFENASMEGDLVGATDGLLDLIYVALGTLYLMGVPADQVWQFVQDANMRKVRGETHRGNVYDAAKPPGWVKPDVEIKKLLDELNDKT